MRHAELKSKQTLSRQQAAQRQKHRTTLEDNRKPEVPVIQQKPNHTGLPDQLKSGMENLSGMSLDHVKVHYNSDKPATVQAHAYAQGSEIHLASGQEKHLPHELGHVVQQAKGQIQATTSVGQVAVNDSPVLEHEADQMGAMALQRHPAEPKVSQHHDVLPAYQTKAPMQLSSFVIQRVIDPAVVRAACQRLGLPDSGHKIVEVPPGVMANTKFKNYPPGHVIGLSAEEQDESLTSIQVGAGKESEYVDATAELLLSLLGGAAYNHHLGAVIITTGMVNYERNLLHELGHHKQNTMSGFNGDNTTTLLLEYHNVLMHENLHPGAKRVSYGMDRTQGWLTKWETFTTEGQKVDFLEQKARDLIEMEETLYQKISHSAKKKEKDLEVYGETAHKMSEEISTIDKGSDNNLYVVRTLYNMIKELESKY
ncbi:eCIS core domain-containing protein [Vibrio mangrovi]|uniref:DUF4157 domain-containing protein n=1 Tax=Vibrio mangrovi TaxID=474394 RepID=A0A1Y6IWF4_9VIBR|nr:DUF4157 domain-containing protein [Vibrio mangrovi]MDW6002504.1 DUF4157 domain-containing protein [Vibrio mangrovi]SMS01966.1 hypothetical protein VIM7927_03277 [Vibrio mangrovi]